MLTKSLAYEKWLGIKKEHQPPSLYRLLAIDAFECDKEVIANAADSRMGFVRQFQAGENSKLSAEILNELSHARIVLLNPQTKADYDAKLRAGLSSDATSTSEKGIEPKSSNVATPLDIVPAKSIPQARRLESVQSIAENDRAATSVDIESLVAESAPAGSGKRQARGASPRSRRGSRSGQRQLLPWDAWLPDYSTGSPAPGRLCRRTPRTICCPTSGRERQKWIFLEASKPIAPAAPRRPVVWKWQSRDRYKTVASLPRLACCRNRRPALPMFGPTMKTAL